MAKPFLVGRVRVSTFLPLRRRRGSPQPSLPGGVPRRRNAAVTLTKLLALLLLLAAKPTHAQTTLTVNTHWADGLKCSCLVTIKQMNADGSTTQVFEASTDNTGHLSTSVTLKVQGVYSLSVYSWFYQIPVFSLPFSTGLVAELPLKSATLNLVFTRPLLNGQPIMTPGTPAHYAAPTLASGTGVQFGI